MAPRVASFRLTPLTPPFCTYLQRGLLFNQEHKLHATYILFDNLNGFSNQVIQRSLSNTDHCVTVLVTELLAGHNEDLQELTPKQFLDTYCTTKDDIDTMKDIDNPSTSEIDAEAEMLKNASVGPIRPVQQTSLINYIAKWNEYQLESEMSNINFALLAAFNPEVAAEVCLSLYKNMCPGSQNSCCRNNYNGYEAIVAKLLTTNICVSLSFVFIS